MKFNFFKKYNRRFLAALCCVLICCSVVLPVAASEGTIDCTYLNIPHDGFVADTMNNVEARYNLGGPTLYCSELVIRYYKEVYGIDIILVTAPVVLNNDDLYFELTDNPKQGDVMFGSAAARGKGYNHYALVKSNNGDSLTLFEQNWRWNGQAGINREITYPTNVYQIYTLKSRSGAALAVLNDPKATASSWATSFIDRAEETAVLTNITDYQANTNRETYCQLALNVARNHGITIPEADTACEAAMQLGLVYNTSGELLLTREETAAITVRLLALIGSSTVCDSSVLDMYDDAERIAAWAREDVSRMVISGLMSGANSKFNPKSNLTNEQAVSLMVRVNDSVNTTYAAANARVASAAAPLQAGDITFEGFNTFTLYQELVRDIECMAICK